MFESFEVDVGSRGASYPEVDGARGRAGSGDHLSGGFFNLIGNGSGAERHQCNIQRHIKSFRCGTVFISPQAGVVVEFICALNQIMPSGPMAAVDVLVLSSSIEPPVSDFNHRLNAMSMLLPLRR
ncbi:MAG: hypothetical protein R3E67_05045 [Pseudomonadales bacterium]